RQIGLLGNEVEQPILVRLERRPAVASAGFIFDAACRRPQVEPTHCCRSGDVEQARDLAPALTLLDQCNRARTQVIRVPPRHGISPPLLTEQPESDLRARWNPLWRFRLVSSRKRSNNTGYMVLEYERGRSLNDWLRSLGRRPTQSELDALVAPLLAALSYKHARGLLHRDIAPDNIILREGNGSPVPD